MSSNSQTLRKAGFPVAVEDLSFAYKRGKPNVLNDVSIECPAGAVTVLTGASGSGKSTLLYLIALMLTPSHGAVTWGASRVDNVPDGRRAALRGTYSGFVFQDAMLDPSRSVLENAIEQGIFHGMTHDQSSARAWELMSRFGGDHRATHRPGEISGGQAQRVALCRALLTDPSVIFADEPTGNPDDAAATLVWDALRERADAGATVIVATHDTRLVSQADVSVTL